MTRRARRAAALAAAAASVVAVPLLLHAPTAAAVVTGPRPEPTIVSRVVCDEGRPNSCAVTVAVPWAAPTMVRVTTEDGTAVAGLDYRGLDTSVEISPTAPEVTAWVALVADGACEGTEDLRVLITGPDDSAVGASISIVDGGC